MSNKIFIGCDVGKGGGIVAVTEDGTVLLKTPMPVTGKEYNIGHIARLLTGKLIDNLEVVHVVIENVHAIQISGRSTAFQFGMGKGILMGVVGACGIPYTLVNPKAWQKEMWEGVTKQYKPANKDGKKSVDPKKTSLVAANRIFPGVDWTKSDLAKNPHDGMVDAALMAEYCRRNFR